ncbi:MAG: hypothetical protein LBU50_01075, partial [Cellulomonas sp.]|nr:hypothetical protein [Cellulomonas sp.]
MTTGPNQARRLSRRWSWVGLVMLMTAAMTIPTTASWAGEPVPGATGTEGGTAELEAVGDDGLDLENADAPEGEDASDGADAPESGEPPEDADPSENGPAPEDPAKSEGRAALDEAGPGVLAGEAVIKVHVGGYRTSETSVSGLSGVKLGLFDAETAGQPLNGTWATAISGADGVATFMVPADQITPGTRWWVKGIAGVSGYDLET